MGTLCAFAPSAHGAAFLGEARIENGGVGEFTAGTVHDCKEAKEEKETKEAKEKM